MGGSGIRFTSYSRPLPPPALGPGIEGASRGLLEGCQEVERELRVLGLTGGSTGGTFGIGVEILYVVFDIDTSEMFMRMGDASMRMLGALVPIDDVSGEHCIPYRPQSASVSI